MDSLLVRLDALMLRVYNITVELHVEGPSMVSFPVVVEIRRDIDRIMSAANAVNKLIAERDELLRILEYLNGK